MPPKRNIYAPYFTSGEAAHVAGIPEKLFSVWLVRSIVRAGRHGKIGAGGKQRRGQRLFSIHTIWEAKIIFQLVNTLDFTASAASEVAKEILKGDWESGDWPSGDWRWAVWRSLKQESPFPVLLLIARIDDSWKIDFCMNGQMKTPTFDREVNRPFAIIPFGLYFWSVYRKCLEILRSSGQITGAYDA